MNTFVVIAIFLVATLQLSLAFSPRLQRTVSIPVAATTTTTTTSQLQAVPESFKGLETKIIATSAVILANIPASVIAAAVEDDYEYGKVDAPIGLAWGVGVLAILTALLPIALRGGEEAFEEIRERDSDSFGKNNKDVLKGKK